MGIGKLGILAGTLALWYSVNGPPKNYLSSIERYNLPEEIKVIETSLPYITRKKIIEYEDVNNIKKEHVELEKIVNTKDIDFSKDFKITTDRYSVVKGNDWLLSRAIGHSVSLLTKLYFWDWDAGLGLNEEKTKAVLSMLENDKRIENLTVRINHNEAFYDWSRMMNEDKLVKRNPFLYRLTVGSLVTLKDEMWAEFARGDYYNPLTNTVVLYSNIESVSAHEIGHHQDFKRFDTDWIYDGSRILPPVMLYQEWKASSNAKNIMSKEDLWQFNRYLLPAFLTYILATIGAVKKIFKNKED